MPTLPLRPINALFVHPKDRYYVVLIQGDEPEHFELHRVSRMKLDSTSWQRRTPYTGSHDDLKLVKNQTITDSALQTKLPTESLPATLHGRSLTFFLSWWQNNGYEWEQNNRASPSASLQTDSANNPSANAISNKPANTPTTQPAQQTAQQPIKKSESTSASNTASITTSATEKAHEKASQKITTSSQTQPEQTKPLIDASAQTNTKTDGADDDFFDSMLAELNDL